MASFTMQFFWEGEKGQGVVPFLRPLTLHLPNIDEMRDTVKRVASDEEMGVHSFTITTEETGAVERWFSLNGEWRCEAA